MPSVIALDVSLSMSRPVAMPDCTEEYQRKNLAVHGINALLDHFGCSFKMEFTAMVIYSYLWEILVPFTRDFESIKTALTKVEEYNKTCIESCLHGVNTLFSGEWGSIAPGHIIFITDECSGIGQGSLKKLMQKWNSRDQSTDQSFPLPFLNPCKIIVMLIVNPSDKKIDETVSQYKELISINGQGGDVFFPDGPINFNTITDMFERMTERFYKPFSTMLHCGNIKCSVQLFPPPEPYKKARDDGLLSRTYTMASPLSICGFLEISDMASPAAVSRHLVLPVSTKDKNKSMNSEQSEVKEETEEPDDGKTPSFTVLLHGSLKVEGMVAIVKVSENWFGMLYSWADSKKKSNLMLALFEPGPNSVSWLGRFDNLSPICSFTDPPYGEDDNKTPFPIRPSDKRSYAQSCVVWIKPAGLQADMQKVLRHARKLPEKQQQFYKELNRLRRAALSFGFLELLEAMATMLERECTLLPGSAHPDAALQLTHAAKALRSKLAIDVTQTIMPLRTNFSEEGT